MAADHSDYSDDEDLDEVPSSYTANSTLVSDKTRPATASSASLSMSSSTSKVSRSKSGGKRSKFARQTTKKEEPMGPLRVYKSVAGRRVVYFPYPAYLGEVRPDQEQKSDDNAGASGVSFSESKTTLDGSEETESTANDEQSDTTSQSDKTKRKGKGDDKVFFRMDETAWRYNCVVNALRRSGMQETKSEHMWNLRWGSYVPEESYKDMKWFQRVNHFAGSSGIGHKGKMARNVSRMRRLHKDHDFSFIPDTYILPGEYSLLASRMESGAKNDIWIVKPQSSSCGKGITLATKMSQIPKKREVVVCKYIANPHLIDGFKYDMRIYVLVTSFNPLRVYIYDEGLARFATSKYTTATSSLGEMYTHLTNFSVNKKNPTYVKGTDNGNEGSKWKISYLRKWMREHGINDDVVFSDINDVIIKSLMSIEHIVVSKQISLGAHSNSSFEIFGFDIILDNKLKPHLLEVNVMPSLSSSSSMDKKIKVRLMADVFHLLGFRAIDPNRASAKQKKVSTSKLVRRVSRSRSVGRNGSLKRAESARSFRSNGDEMSSRGSSTRSAAVLLQNRLDKMVLLDDDVSKLRDFAGELERCGHFVCIFPQIDTFERFGSLTETMRYYNVLLYKWLCLSPSARQRVLEPPKPISALRARGSSRQSSSSSLSLKDKRRSESSTSLARTRPGTSGVSRSSLSSSSIRSPLSSASSRRLSSRGSANSSKAAPAGARPSLATTSSDAAPTEHDGSAEEVHEAVIERHVTVRTAASAMNQPDTASVSSSAWARSHELHTVQQPIPKANLVVLSRERPLLLRQDVSQKPMHRPAVYVSQARAVGLGLVRFSPAKSAAAQVQGFSDGIGGAGPAGGAGASGGAGLGGGGGAGGLSMARRSRSHSAGAHSRSRGDERHTSQVPRSAADALRAVLRSSASAGKRMSLSSYSGNAATQSSQAAPPVTIWSYPKRSE